MRNIDTMALNVTDRVGLWGTIGTGRGTLTVNGTDIAIEPNGTFAALVQLPDEEPAALTLLASEGDSTISRVVMVRRANAETAANHAVVDTPVPASGWVRLVRPLSDTADAATQARPIYSRWTPGGALAVALPQETTWPVDASTDSALRLRLSEGVAVWVPRSEAPSVPAPRDSLIAVTAMQLGGDSSRSQVSLSMTSATASTVDIMHDTVTWTLYRSRMATDKRSLDDEFVRSLEASTPNPGRVQVRVVLSAVPLGWRVAYRNGAMVLDLRRDLVTDLRGLRVAVDAGHPPGGATGPAGLREDVLTLRVAREIGRLLGERGATAILTREDSLPLSLDGRLVRAEAADAHVFVSLHADAPGDGRHPSSADFTRVHWWQPLSRSLASAMLGALFPALGTEPNGFPRSNLAVLRASWFPAILIEPTTIALPHREAFLASDEGVRRYAEGVVAGITAWVTRLR